MSLPLFNSLGSNYSPEFVRLATSLFWRGKQKNEMVSTRFLEKLEQRFHAKGLLVYKGRDAIELAVQAIVSLQSDTSKTQQFGVLTQGLACHAIEEGMLRVGVTPIYVDLQPGTLGPSVRTLEESMRRAKAQGVQIIAVFLQHTLGYVNPRSEIFSWAKKYNLLVIEDLAQSFGAQDEHGQEVGQNADVIICSFGRDKVIDAVSGGAVLVHEKHKQLVQQLVKLQPIGRPPFSAIKKEMFYPKLTEVIRTTHAQGVGKIVFKLAKVFHLFTSPIKAATTVTTQLPSEYAQLAAFQLNNLEHQLHHRRQVAAVYFNELQKVLGLTVMVSPNTINGDIHLRVPIFFENAQDIQKVVKNCQHQHIYLTDRWYRSVVDSGSLHRPTVYVPGTCPHAEKTALCLLNLPTHEKIALTDAHRICAIIKQAIRRTS